MTVIRVMERPIPTKSRPIETQNALVAYTTISDPIQIDPPVKYNPNFLP